MGGTLHVRRISEAELRFQLHLSQAPQTVVTEATTFLDDERRRNISVALTDFAECLEGFHEHEPKFMELGQILFSMVVPQDIWDDLRNLEGPLTILTDDPTLPWEVLHDDEEFLALKRPIARQLIIRERMRRILRLPNIRPEGFSALVIADPTDDLPGARDEGEALVKLFRAHGTCVPLFGDDATYQNILRQFVRRPYSVIHYCGHVDYDSTKRLSSIRLRAGRLSADDVLPMFRGNPVVFLNACYSDLRLEAQMASARTESFAQAFMLGNEKGVATAVIGTMWRIPDEPDEAGREFSLTFYQCLLKGGSIGEAMRISRAMARQRKWGPMVWGPYVLYGNPSLKPFEGHIAKTSPSGAAEQVQEEPIPEPPDAEMETQVPPGPASPLDDELEEALPLDTTARQVFYVALREMQQMEQGALSSMHLLIGLCEADLDVLKQVLREKMVGVSQVCEEARQRAKELIPAQEESFGISMNVALMLVLAARRAKRFNKERITGEDLLAGLCECEDSKAVHILESFDIYRRELLDRLSPQREPDKCRFDRTTGEAMQHAVSCARQAHLDFIGTPHLLIGLIRTGGIRTIALLRKRSVNLEQLCEALRTGVGQNLPQTANGGGAPSPHLRPRCHAILQRAQKYAQRTASGEITENHLLQAILEEPEGFTVEVLQAVGADPKKLLADMQDTEAIALHLLRVLGADPEELLIALQRTAKQGNT